MNPVVDTSDRFLLPLADVKRMVTLLPEHLLFSMGNWMVDQLLFGRNRDDFSADAPSDLPLRGVGRSPQPASAGRFVLIRSPSATPPRPIPGSTWEVMGWIRRLLHELDEERITLLRLWCSAQLRFA